MNSLLIKKLIKTNNESYPEVTFSNPLLDKKVTKALARSFVKILTTCKENSNVNNNTRTSVLENIRKLCVVQPENHVKLEETFIEQLCKFYINNKQENKSNNSDINKKLDTFLLQTHKDLDLSTSIKSNFNPEILQSIINLNNHSSNNVSETMYKDILHWNTEEQYSIIVNNLWNNNENLDINILNDLSVKMIPHIEKVTLNICTELLKNKDYNISNVFTSNKEFSVICNISFKSSNCFQAVSSILNYVFIMTHFNGQIEKLITEYVNHVKANCVDSFAILCQNHLSCIVHLLDIDINDLASPLQSTFIDSVTKSLRNIHDHSESDLIMLLSHFPEWFNLYHKS